ncbi:S-layer homology domain-containing protein [Bacillus chungangensis]|uniref:SLH domain-containing protein n=1 Tax=Bacillus chungangensis TaxID=587633 RepID=A0ABT9WW98_9BACI|nr:S-layer homology domain-containing protein [Bacillus chungangensis]MDQ0177152.1 hypothetical protein [Bacillus chungangensis]
MAYQPKSYRKFLATSMTAAMVATAVAPITGLAASSFPDVAEGTPYTEPINALAKMKVFEGFNDGTFKIRNKVTRAQAARVLSLIRGFDLTASAAPFPDVKQGVWYSEGINAAYKAGVITGKPSGQFEPNTELTRAEFALMTMQAYGVEPKNDVTLPFTDVKDAWYTEAIKTLYADGVIKGLTTTTFGPNDTIDRGDLAILLYTAEQIYGDGIVGDTQIKAVNNTTVEITYKEEVKDVKASDFEISGLKVENAAIKQSDNKTVVLTTAKQKGGEKYTVKQSGKEIGKFEGISAVIPEKISLADTAVQGVVGKQVTLKADVGVKEAGIPVTFNVQAAAGSLNKSHVEEALTNAEGIAEYSYTQYAAGYNDDVAVYPTGAPAHRANAKVFWGVNEILKIEADDKAGDKLNNNETKAYKITYNDPKTGNPVPGAKFHVTFAENVNVTVDKTSKATVNGVNPVQLTNNTLRTAEVTTDGNGVAKFTVTGSNTKVTPVVYQATTIDNKTDARLLNDNLRVYAKELQFGAIQSEYKITVTRDGGEKAAAGEKNGRKYNVEVKDKDGKVVPNQVLNVGFMENLDRNVNTSTDAYFTKDEKKIADKTTTIKLDKDGKASFTIASDNATGNEYATPVVWYNIGNSNTGENTYHETSPQQKGEITYFERATFTTTIVELREKDSNSEYKGDKEALIGNKAYDFVLLAGNQSGTKYNSDNSELSQPSSLDGTFTIRNTGDNSIKVNGKIVSPGSPLTVNVNGKDRKITVETDGDKNASLEVTATASIPANTVNNNSSTIYLGTSKAVKAKFKSTTDVGQGHVGLVTSFDKSKKEIKLEGKDLVKYKDKTVSYYDVRNGNTGLTEGEFNKLVEENINFIKVRLIINGDNYRFEVVGIDDKPADITVTKNAQAFDTSNPQDGVADTVEVTFSEAIDPAKVSKDIFTFAGDEITATKAEVKSNDDKTVVITIKGAKNDRKVTDLTISDVKFFGKNKADIKKTTVKVEDAINQASEDTDAVEKDLAGLNLAWDGTNGASATNPKLILAKTGDKGSTITWNADPSNVIDVNTGIVTRHQSDSKVVELKATVKKGDAKEEKVFYVTVPVTGDVTYDDKAPDLDQDAVDSAKATFDTPIVNDKDGANPTLTLLTDAGNGVTVSWGSNKTGVVATDGTINRGTSNETVILKATFTKNGKTAEQEYTVTVPVTGDVTIQ